MLLKFGGEEVKVYQSWVLGCLS